MKKSSKRLIISTHAKNKVGFRTRTAGIDLAGFTANPLLLWMHKRPTGERTDEVLPLGYWDDVKLNGEELSGVPVFDDKDEFAMKIYHKVENGTIRIKALIKVLRTLGENPTEEVIEGVELELAAKKGKR